jgi:glycosyltransferase involved in cell wall biosynthesis
LQALALADAPRDIMLHIVGDGPSRAPLTRLAQELRVYTRVRFHGFRTDVNDFLAHADALLMPSLHEGLPYTLLEALALQVPVIATEVGGLREVLRDDRTALLIASENPPAIARALRRLFCEPNWPQRRRARVGSTFRRRDGTRVSESLCRSGFSPTCSVGLKPDLHQAARRFDCIHARMRWRHSCTFEPSYAFQNSGPYL